MEVLDEEYDNKLNHQNTVLMIVTLIGCPPCIRLAPVIKEISDLLSICNDIMILHISRETVSFNFMEKHGVTHFPFIQFYNSGYIVKRFTNVPSLQRILRFILESDGPDSVKVDHTKPNNFDKFK